MTIKYFFSLFLPIALSTLVSCKGGNAFVSADGGDTLHLKYADHLSLVKYPDYVKATVRNPWDTTAVLHTYVLVPDSVSVPEGLPEEWTVVRTPLKSALIYSSVHNSLVTELGALDAISGVCGDIYTSEESCRQDCRRPCGRMRNGNFAQHRENHQPQSRRCDAVAL